MLWAVTSVVVVRIARAEGDAQVFRFPPRAIDIGRTLENDLVLDDASVSPRHARILVKDGRLIIVDLKSETGTFVDGRRLTSYPSLKTDLRNAGAEWVDEEVVVDSGLVSSRTPRDLPAFNAKVVEEIAEGAHADQTA